MFLKSAVYVALITLLLYRCRSYKPSKLQSRKQPPNIAHEGEKKNEFFDFSDTPFDVEDVSLNSKINFDYYLGDFPHEHYGISSHATLRHSNSINFDTLCNSTTSEAMATKFISLAHPGIWSDLLHDGSQCPKESWLEDIASSGDSNHKLFINVGFNKGLVCCFSSCCL